MMVEAVHFKGTRDDVAVSAANPLPVSLGASASIDIGDVQLLAGTAIIGQVLPVAITTATQANVSASATAVTLMTAKARKPGSNIVNDSTAILYIKLGSTASATDYWEVIDGKTTIAGSQRIPDGYDGIVTGLWASATGSARVTEMT